MKQIQNNEYRKIHTSLWILKISRKISTNQKPQEHMDPDPDSDPDASQFQFSLSDVTIYLGDGDPNLGLGWIL